MSLENLLGISLDRIEPSHAVGFTCEEVFAAVQFPDDASTIVRIRLDSLGPGSPPD